MTNVIDSITAGLPWACLINWRGVYLRDLVLLGKDKLSRQGGNESTATY
ncbi:MAG: hypothetical protein KatS3mg028_1696 [Bacteroidia bacterium]|nr:MAG: hypothetical protein KatS3mg028_1696 [Bacteroidia bacterium]